MWINVLDIDFEFNKASIDILIVRFFRLKSFSLLFVTWGNYYSNKQFELEIFGLRIISL